MAYLALSKVADAVFSTAPNPTPTARPSETDTRRARGVRDGLPPMLTAVTGSSGGTRAPGTENPGGGSLNRGQQPMAWAESSSLLCVWGLQAKNELCILKLMKKRKKTKRRIFQDP